MIRKFVAAERSGADEVVLWGDGTPTREFLYVEDAAAAITLACERYDGEEPVNVGSGEELTVAALATLIAEKTGYRGAIRWDTSKPNGQPRRKLDVSRAAERFGFRASTPLAAGLEKTIEWFRTQ
jgi:GDP-L-fucose synthase